MSYNDGSMERSNGEILIERIQFEAEWSGYYWLILP